MALMHKFEGFFSGVFWFLLWHILILISMYVLLPFNNLLKPYFFPVLIVLLCNCPQVTLAKIAHLNDVSYDFIVFCNLRNRQCVQDISYSTYYASKHAYLLTGQFNFYSLDLVDWVCWKKWPSSSVAEYLMFTTDHNF